TDRLVVQQVLAGVLDSILRLVYPIMPFVAESIWQVLNDAAFERGLPAPEPAAESVVIAAWPAYPAVWQDAAIESRVGRMQELVRGIREIRNRYMLEPRTRVEVNVRTSNDIAEDFRALNSFITALGGVAQLTCGPDTAKPTQAIADVHPEFEAYVSLRGLID